MLKFSIVFFIFLYFPGHAFAGNIKGAVKVKGLRSPANILVYLSKAPAASGEMSTTKLVMDQRNLEFIPHVLPILVGSTVQFPNNDKVDHNVFSMSRRS
jgi:plastocyanin